MKARLVLLLLIPVLLAAQAPPLDGGRLDPTWFASGVEFERARRIDLQWISPALTLKGRVIRVVAWEPPRWLGGRRTEPDRAFLGKVAESLEPLLAKGLGKGLGGLAEVSRTEGDMLLAGRVVDARGSGGDYLSTGSASLTLDLKLTDRSSGALLGAFHHTVRAMNEEDLLTFFELWCGDLARYLKEKAAPSPAPALAAPSPAPKPAPAPAAALKTPPAPAPAFDLQATLLRLEALRRDGILSEEEFRALKAKAEGLAREK